MERLKHILVNFFISPELIGTLLLYLVYLVNSQPFIWIADKLLENELLIYAPIAPAALLSFSVVNMRKILSPNISKKKVYYQWECYQQVKDTTYLGVFFLLIGLIMSVLPLIIGVEYLKGLSGLLLLTAYSICLITSATMLFASQSVEEILEANT
ncbi:MAG: hypothetical protein WEA58_15605 [Balneolaceae bacterium]